MNLKSRTQSAILDLLDRIRRNRRLRPVRQWIRSDYFFAITIFLPTILLSYFALNSIQAQELSFDVDISERSSAIRARIHEEKEGGFHVFEERVKQRLDRGQLPVTSLGELSPFLLTAFSLDKQNQIIAPFRPPEPLKPFYPSKQFEVSFHSGLQWEQKGRSASKLFMTTKARQFYLNAMEEYRTAAQSTTDQRLIGQAEFATARALWKSGANNPEDAFGDIIAKFPAERDERGFRLTDLARLTQAEIGLARDPDAGLYAMRELVDQLLSETWTIGEAGESQIAVRALAQLEKLRAAGAQIDAAWITQSSTRLNERKTQLYWSRALLDDVEGVTRTANAEDKEINYLPSISGEGVMWATMRTNEQLLLFAFDQGKLIESLETQARDFASLDPDIQARIRPTSQQTRAREMVTNLGPQLPYSELVIALSDPQQIADRKWRYRTMRFAIIFLAIGMIGLGIFFSMRMIAHQLEVARTKADFAANVSHELRSPITQIRLKGESLQLDLCVDDDDRKLHYDAIVRESERLSRLVDNVLDFSAIERGAKKYIFRPEDVQQMLETTIASIQGSFEGADAEIFIEIPRDLPVVWVDREAISQVIVNLVSNAVKYGGETKWVSISAQHTDSKVEISVTDRGIGIRPEDLEHIFDNFYRSTDTTVRKEKGTGIGLSIVQYIVQAHGGHISVKSILGEGTTFTVHLPLEAPKASGA